jgi:hypothetical protein
MNACMVYRQRIPSNRTVIMLSWFGQKTKYFDKLTYIIQLYYTARVWL